MKILRRAPDRDPIMRNALCGYCTPALWWVERRRVRVVQLMVMFAEPLDFLDSDLKATIELQRRMNFFQSADRVLRIYPENEL